MNSKIILLGMCLCFFISCNNTPNKLYKYIKSNCQFQDCGKIFYESNFVEDTCFCYIDLRQALNIDFDTMYIFREYTPLTVIQDILDMKDYKQSSRQNTELLVKEGYLKIILLKNHKIVHEDDFKFQKIIFQNGTIIEGKGIFDSNPIKDHAFLYISPFFKVIKISGGRTKEEVYYLVGNISNYNFSFLQKNYLLSKKLPVGHQYQ